MLDKSKYKQFITVNRIENMIILGVMLFILYLFTHFTGNFDRILLMYGIGLSLFIVWLLLILLQIIKIFKLKRKGKQWMKSN